VVVAPSAVEEAFGDLPTVRPPTVLMPAIESRSATSAWAASIGPFQRRENAPISRLVLAV
jgi:hypothetical protein